MSEIIRPGHEVRPSPESHHGKERHVTSEQERHHLKENQAEIQRQVEAHAVSGKEIAGKTAERPTEHPHHRVTKEIKELTFSRKLVRIRKRLSLPDRALSGVIHQPTVERVSEVVGKTIARPSGLLGGGIAAFFGTFGLLYVTRQYGYEFNYLAFVLLFVAGFALGATIEIVVFAIKHRNSYE